MLPLLATLLVFAPILDGQFAYDDHLVITENLAVTSVADLAFKLSPGGARAQGETTYRPLVTATYVAAYNLLGRGARAQHAVDLLLHGLAAFLLAAFLLRQRVSPPAAAFGALVFALHPLATGTVSMIGFREEPLIAVLGLSALLLVSARRSRLARLSGLGLFFLVPFAKETGLAFGPLSICLGDRTDRSRWPRALAATGLAVASFALLVWINRVFTKSLDMASQFDMPWSARAAVAGQSVFSYVTRLVSWRDLSPLHDDIALSTEFGWISLAGLVVLAGLALLFATALKKPSALSLAGGLAFLAWLPTLGLLLPFWAKQADRFCYVPLAALGIAAGVGVDRLDRRFGAWSRPVRWATVGAAAALLVVFAAYTRAELPRYHDSYSLFGSVTARQPMSHLGRLFFAQELMDRGRHDQARRYLETVVRNHPRDLKALSSLAQCLVELGRPADAAQLLQNVDIANLPGTPGDRGAAAVNLQAAYFASDRLDAGFALTRDFAANTTLPQTTRARLLANAAIAAYHQHDYELAANFAAVALSLNPTDATMRRLRADAGAKIGAP